MSPEPLDTSVRPAFPPARSSRGPILAGCLLFVAAAPAIDDWTQHRLAAQPPSPILDHPLWLLTRPEVLLGLVGASAGLAAIAPRRGRAAAAPRLMRLFTTGLIALSTSMLLKLMIGRARPDSAGGDPMAFAPGAFDRAFQSLPSTGAAVATALAIGLVRWRPSLAQPALAALVVICAERIASRAHWPSDVFAGVVLGLLVVRLTRAKDQDGSR